MLKALVKDKKHLIMLQHIRGITKYIVFSFICVLLLQYAGLVPPAIMKMIVDDYIPSGDLHQTYMSIVILCGIPLVSTLINIFYTSQNAIAARRLGFQLKRKVFLNLMKQPMRFFDQAKSAELTTYCGKEINNYIAFWMMDVPTLLANLITSVTVAVILFRIDPVITLVQLAALPILFIPSHFLEGKIKSYTSEIIGENAKANHIINESFVGIRLIKSSRLEGRRISQLEAVQNKITKIWGKTVAWERLAGDWSQQLVSAAFIGLSFAMGALQVIHDHMTIGALIAYVTYLPKIHGFMIQLATNKLTLKKQLAEHEKTFEFLNMPTEQDETEPSMHGEVSFSGQLEFRDVCFAYPDSPQTILKHTCFSVSAGEWIGIVGPSGAGKSTLFDLLLKFYKPDQGEILIGGVDMTRISPDQVRTHIALVSQETFLFAGTLRENLMLSNLYATEAQMMEAIRLANLSAFVGELPDGLDTDIGENGAKLSGGQKQRISLARAILSNSKILLLDEVTSNLDPIAEKEIQNAIEEIRREKQVTVLAIAHRVSFLAKAARILVLEKGEITDEGTFLELMERNLLFQSYENASQL